MTRESSSAPEAAPLPSASDHWEDTDLAGLSPRARERLQGIASHAEFIPGQPILIEGALTPFLGVVEAGRVGLRLTVPERGPQTILTIEAGELVGWSAVVEPYRASAAAVALTPTEIRCFEASRLRELLASDCELAAELLPIVLRCVSDRLGTSWQQLLDLFAARNVEPW